jgi:excisionase family DNA binding protein
MATEDGKVLMVADLMERWSLTSWAVYDLVRRGKIPALRIGRRLRFRLADIERYEEQHTVPSVEEL